MALFKVLPKILFWFRRHGQYLISKTSFSWSITPSLYSPRICLCYITWLNNGVFMRLFLNQIRNSNYETLSQIFSFRFTHFVCYSLYYVRPYSHVTSCCWLWSSMPSQQEPPLLLYQLLQNRWTAAQDTFAFSGLHVCSLHILVSA
jgi:hypothetical protein